MRKRALTQTITFLATLTLITSAAAPPTMAAGAAVADLRADVNRDGVVDLVGGTDEVDEQHWTTTLGAVVLPNLDDDLQRCSRDESQSDRALAACNDGADQVVNGPDDVLDLAPLRTVPLAMATARASGTVALVGQGASMARIFVHRGTQWTRLRAADPISAAELRAGVQLGVEAKDVVRDRQRWRGAIKVRLSVTQDGKTTTDVVVMHVAPLLTQHALQPAEQVLVTDTGDPGQDQFRADLAEQVAAAGIAAPVVELDEEYDIWTQDYFEPAYTSMTGPDGTAHVLRILIRSAQNRWAGRLAFTALRGPDVGAIQMRGDQGWNTLDSMGNLETIPPYTHNGESYPAGRIIMGQRSDTQQPTAQLLETLRAQRMQDPLLLDTSWLYVGHVNEFVQFLPADTPRGWKIGIADPNGGLDLLRAAQAAGHGATSLFSLPNMPSETIDEALADPKLIADNALAAGVIAANLAVLVEATGVTEDEVVAIPSLFSRSWPTGGATPGAATMLPDPDDAAPGSEVGERTGRVQTVAHIPGAINGVILSRTSYLAPQQWGPVIDGVDIFGSAVQTAYAQVGMAVSFVDDWYPYHLGLGEVQCATNVYRAADTPWWHLG